MKIKQQKAFFPISLGNHYYTNEVLVAIKNTVAFHQKKSLLVICDHLRYLSYKIRGIPSREIDEKINKEVSEFRKRLINCGFSDSTIEDVTMTSLINEEDFLKIQEKILCLICDNEVLFEYLNELSMYSLEKNNGIQNMNNQDIQTQYFISECTLSIYVTEILGFENEYYKQFDRGLIVILYEKYGQDIKSIINKTYVKRKFRSLKEVLL